MGTACPHSAAATGTHYQRRRPELTPLYRLVQQHAQTYLAQAEAVGAALPRFVTGEFHAYLKCGILAHGYMRLRCDTCACETLVAFSCKLRGFCPSCGTQRMNESAAYLVDDIIPHVPVRQWVLSFPIPLRSLFAVHPELLTPVLAVIQRIITTHLIRQAGIARNAAVSGAVTLIQRFGSAANLNIHLHGLWLDGVYQTAGTAGGGLDTAARALDSAMHEAKLIEQPMIINNMGGAAGDAAKNYVHQKKGDVHVLYVESNRMFQNKIVGTTQLDFDNFVPLARLITEYLVWVVRADAPFRSAKDILDQVKGDPTAVTFGVGSMPSNDYFNIVRPAMQYGVDYKKLRIAAFRNTLNIQVQGGHVHVISTTASEALEHARSGKARLLATSAPSPQGGGLKGVPQRRAALARHGYRHADTALARPVRAAGHAARGGRVLGRAPRQTDENRGVEKSTRTKRLGRRVCGFFYLPQGT